MNSYVFALILGLFFSFVVYWYIRFKYILPIEKRVNYIDDVYLKFQLFSKEIINNSYIPDTIGEYYELANHQLSKLHKFFPELVIILFEKQDNKWRIKHSISSEKIGNNLISDLVINILDRALTENDIIFIDNLSENLKKTFKNIAVFPFISSDKKLENAIFIMINSKKEFETILPYMKFLSFNLHYLYKVYEKTIKYREENVRNKKELNAVLNELDMAGSRLIKKAKERKAIREVFTIDRNNSISALDNIISIAGKVIEADLVSFYYYADEKKELSIYGKSYSTFEGEINHNISLLNDDSLYVKSFSEKRTIISSSHEDQKSFSYFIENFGLKSFYIAPVFLNENMIGLLHVASKNSDFFNNENIEFLNIINNQISEIMGVVSLSQTLSQKAQELAQLNKVKDEFLSTVSHELKTPLTTIKGFVSVLLSGEAGALSDQQMAFLNIVEQSSDRLAMIISNLLDISKLDGKLNFEKEKFNLVEVIKDSVNNLSVKASEKNIKIRLDNTIKNAYILGDRHWIMQAVDNLIMNAIKYSYKDSNIDVNLIDRGDVIMVSIRDYGMGIDEEDKLKIFDKFYRGKNSQANTQGTGLGLAICKTIIERHEGKIWVESSKGKGSSFYFALPKLKI